MCGSDKAGVHGEHAFMKPPYYPGHEVVGVVVAVADGVDTVEVGDRVTIEPTLPCGHCKPCLHQMENLCENLQFFGCGYREGGMADVFSVPAARLHKIPENFTNYQAALIEPLATPVHAVRIAGNLPANGSDSRRRHHRVTNPDRRPPCRGGQDREHRHIGEQARPGSRPRS